MYRIFHQKIYLALTLFFVLCVCAYAFLPVVNGISPCLLPGDKTDQGSNSLSNTALPKAYFVPDRSEYWLLGSREFVPECLFVMLVFSTILFVNFIYCVRSVDIRAKSRIVLLI